MLRNDRSPLQLAAVVDGKAQGTRSVADSVFATDHVDFHEPLYSFP
ncbi:hypothetical protein ACFY5D_11655 [Paeniglutamicibacter sp. NPDC012692]